MTCPCHGCKQWVWVGDTLSGASGGGETFFVCAKRGEGMDPCGRPINPKTAGHMHPNMVGWRDGSVCEGARIHEQLGRLNQEGVINPAHRQPRPKP